MQQHRSAGHLLRRGVLVAVAGLLATSAAVQPVAAQDLEDRRDRVAREIDRRATRLDQSHDRLVVATERQQQALESLRAARSALAHTRGELAVAKAFDVRMQERLDAAVAALETARAELTASRAHVADQETRLAGVAVESYQSGDPGLMALSMVLSSQDPAELGGQLNSVRDVLDKESVALQRLEASRVLLAVQEKRFEEARAEVAEQRAAAAQNLRLKQQLETRAEQAEASIRELAVAAGDARDEAASALAEDERQMEALEAERERVSSLLRQRAREARAAARAEARRQARAEARERARAEARAEARKKAEESRKSGQGRDRTRTPQPPRPPARPPVRQEQTFTLSSPVNGYLTSSYGMRLHPVYKRWSLHDGTDYGASCGTPIRAAASGTVVSVYSHTAYGKRVIIDHGYQRRVGLGTAYNHLSSYSTHVGQQVERGEVIGYVGSTGYSTGCHLHFMVFENGATVDPMSWL